MDRKTIIWIVVVIVIIIIYGGTDQGVKLTLMDYTTIDKCNIEYDEKINEGYNCVVKTMMSPELENCIEDCGSNILSYSVCAVFYETDSCRTTQGGSFGPKDTCIYNCIVDYGEDIYEPPATELCWDGTNQYLSSTGAAQSRKFCKCVMGTYGYSGYNVYGQTLGYAYTDAYDNDNWGVTQGVATMADSVKCNDGNWYYTNVDYYYPPLQGCNTDADTDCNAKVCDGELLSHMSKWKVDHRTTNCDTISGCVSDAKLLSTMTEWKNTHKTC